MTGNNASIAAAAGATQGVILILCSLLPVMAIVSLVPVMPLLFRQFGAVPGAEYLTGGAEHSGAVRGAVFPDRRVTD
jgi:hypothetical protein